MSKVKKLFFHCYFFLRNMFLLYIIFYGYVLKRKNKEYVYYFYKKCFCFVVLFRTIVMTLQRWVFKKSFNFSFFKLWLLCLWHFSSGYKSSVFTNIFSPHIATDYPNTRHTLVIGLKQCAFGTISVLRDRDITDHCVYDVMVLRLTKRAIRFNKPQKPIERKLNKNPAIRCGSDTL